jgi:hypothetical protein
MLTKASTGVSFPKNISLRFVKENQEQKKYAEKQAEYNLVGLFSGQTAGDGNFFFVQIGFSLIKSPNSSRKSIKNFFWKLRNQYFILTSFIESKKH